MELRDFVANVLTQITEGIIKANENLKNYEGVEVAPDIRTVNLPTDVLPINCEESNYLNRAFPVTFDVAVTVSQTKGQAGGAGISVVAGWFGGQKNKSDAHVNISRINFIVPMRWPSSKQGNK